MKLSSKLNFTLILVLGLTMLLLSACAQTTNTPDATADTTSTQTCPEPTPCPEVPETVAAPFEDLWANSPHADKNAEAFRHWDEDDPMEVPVACATCHSSGGFEDFLGLDGSEMFVVDQNAPVDSVIECQTCHNDAALTLTSVKFPSGVELTGLGQEAICMSCHLGRESKVQVDEAITVAGVDEDTVSADLSFINIHYAASAVVRYGTEVQGGYEYDGMTYDVVFEHVQGVETCQDCHNPHSLEINIETCAECHEANSVEDLHDVREPSSSGDYDGDGNVAEGMYYEIEGLKELLFNAMLTYSSEVTNTPLAYDSGSHPYFFNDTNDNGVADEDEINRDNAFTGWTPRLLKAAYNYQLVIKDPGGYAHGGKYLVQLMHDSIADLNSVVDTPIDLSMAARDDAGHFASNAEAWRHWDADGEVPGTCAKCHTATGLPQYIAEGTNISNEATSGLWCQTCHNVSDFPAVFTQDSVKFPSGAMLGFDEKPEANLCLNCHQGRESTVSVNAAIGDSDPDTVIEGLSFINVHYFAAGSTLFGTEAKGVYEYADKTYLGQNQHITGFKSCVDCHDVHALDVRLEVCQGCHQKEDPKDIRMSSLEDYDGDGNKSEGLYYEIETLSEKLYAAILAKSVESELPLVYDGNSHPYFFNDTNVNGIADPEEVTRANAFTTWTPRLLKAAYNYQYVLKDPGVYAHNPLYIMQVLYDSIEDLGGDVTNLVRP